MTDFGIDCVICGARLTGRTVAEFRAAMTAHEAEHPVGLRIDPIPARPQPIRAGSGSVMERDK